MQMFIVLTPVQSMAVDIAIMTAFPGRFFKYSSDVWMVLERDDWAGPHHVADTIGLNTKEGVTGVVISVGTFYGVASPELTAWLHSHGYDTTQQRLDPLLVETTRTNGEDLT